MKLKLAPKLRIFLPIFVAIIISVSVITIVSINISKNSLNIFIKENLQLEVKTLVKMFEREYALKLEQVKTDLHVAHDYFYSKPFRTTNRQIEFTAINQISGKQHQVNVSQWLLDGEQIQKQFSFVDQMQDLLGGTATIFQKIDSGYLRISTNVPDDEGGRAIGTYIPNFSPVVQSIEKGEAYFGRAFVVNDWYITAYEPIRHENQIIGMLYVGSPEKDIAELREIVLDLKIGKSGFPFVFDDNATFIIHPVSEGENWAHLEFMQKIMEIKKGTLRYYSPTTETSRFMAFEYFEGFHFYVGATIDPGIETRNLVSTIVFNSILIGLVILILLSAFVYFVAAENIHKFLQTIEISNEKLSSAREALKRSEKLAELGQLSARIVQEISEPLKSITDNTKSIKEEFDQDSSVYNQLDKIGREAEKSKSILSGILTFAEGQKLTLKETNINDMMEMVIRDIELPANINLTFIKDPDNAMAFLDTGMMIQAIRNLLNNAVESVIDEGQVTVENISDPDYLTIRIKDNGPGISKKDTGKIFEPFYTLRDSIVPKAGLGLSVSYGIIKMHRGKIELKTNNDPAKGSTFTEFIINLPRNYS
ncbi:MAG: Cache 3/Cache 2 fusion domain-containing protein [Bacteroidales bacterium]|nr:Cache 3/Cache 2 fusion domain-containing protein [Bacteroidales bacterium]MCF8343377.1 Cache 3/Cache 2 fusion domain-containing protein [Bacteroidales bacterium]MCF8350477.1 Cache 3/Cache 2 fusion domain-containing protein [Bacteroidales bacterium]MCF8375478.1 Cache 3/Cache 2 fusion domain-containing protein [Bacteroidales bacterium]MCF8399877.1 Cache 3/Cache 2 fusion domain-containing protein [Bacteroidales bacterium]